MTKISWFPILLAAAVIVNALFLNLTLSSPTPEGERIRRASELVAQVSVASDQGRLPQAIDLARQALALNPTHLRASLLLGIAFLNINNLDAAEQEFRRLIELAAKDNSTLAWAHNNLGVVFQRKGRFEDALNQYARAVTIDPFNNTARANLAEVKGRLNR